MATGIRCSRCEVLNRNDVQACRACGAPLPTLAPQPSADARASTPTPAPNNPPRILRPAQPAPLRPPSLSQLPSSAQPVAKPPPPALVTQPVEKAPDRPAEVPPPASPPVVATEAASASSTPPTSPAPPSAARRTPTARAVTPPPQRPAARARPAQATPARPARPAPDSLASDESARPRVRATSLLQALAATLIDGLLAGGLALAVAALAAPSLTGPAAPRTEGVFGVLELILRSPAILVVFGATALLASTLLHLGAVPLLGSTLGGRLTGVRLIVRSTGAPPSAGRAALRGLISALGGVLLLTGPLWALWIDPLRRGLGDVVSGTLPIKR